MATCDVACTVQQTLPAAVPSFAAAAASAASGSATELGPAGTGRPLRRRRCCGDRGDRGAGAYTRPLLSSMYAPFEGC
jgi:hypothetical protein